MIGELVTTSSISVHCITVSVLDIFVMNTEQYFCDSNFHFSLSRDVDSFNCMKGNWNSQPNGFLSIAKYICTN